MPNCRTVLTKRCGRAAVWQGLDCTLLWSPGSGHSKAAATWHRGQRTNSTRRQKHEIRRRKQNRTESHPGLAKVDAAHQLAHNQDVHALNHLHRAGKAARAQLNALPLSSMRAVCMTNSPSLCT